jgi:hypothetical protein
MTSWYFATGVILPFKKWFRNLSRQHWTCLSKVDGIEVLFDEVFTNWIIRVTFDSVGFASMTYMTLCKMVTYGQFSLSLYIYAYICIYIIYNIYIYILGGSRKRWEYLLFVLRQRRLVFSFLNGSTKRKRSGKRYRKGKQIVLWVVTKTVLVRYRKRQKTKPDTKQKTNVVWDVFVFVFQIIKRTNKRIRPSTNNKNALNVFVNH